MVGKAGPARIIYSPTVSFEGTLSLGCSWYIPRDIPLPIGDIYEPSRGVGLLQLGLASNSSGVLGFGVQGLGFRVLGRGVQGLGLLN